MIDYRKIVSFWKLQLLFFRKRKKNLSMIPMISQKWCIVIQLMILIFYHNINTSSPHLLTWTSSTCSPSYICFFFCFFSFILHSNHDKRYVPHPAEMGPEESGDPHSDRGETAGAVGHAGRIYVYSIITLRTGRRQNVDNGVKNMEASGLLYDV